MYIYFIANRSYIYIYIPLYFQEMNSGCQKRMDFIRKSINEICLDVNSTNILPFLLHQITHPDDGKFNSIPKSVSLALSKLYGQLKYEIDDLINENNGYGKDRRNYKLLSMLDRNIIDEIIRKSISESHMMEEKFYDAEDYDHNDEEILEENEINCTDREPITRKILELQLIEVISIPPSAIQKEVSSTEKKDVSVQVGIDIQHEQMESISAASVHSRMHNMHESNNSSVSTTELASKDQSSELSTGQIDQIQATYLFANNRDRLSLYNVDKEGTIRNIGGTAHRNMEDDSHPLENTQQTSHKDQQVDKRHCDSESVTPIEPEVAEIIPRRILGNLIVAREVSFQSSFDTAALLQQSNSSKPPKVDEIRNASTQAHQKEDNVEDEETLNQITPIPTTLELSS